MAAQLDEPNDSPFGHEFVDLDFVDMTSVLQGFCAWGASVDVTSH